jgi:hypothetical protein
MSGTTGDFEKVKGGVLLTAKIDSFSFDGKMKSYPDRSLACYY